MATSPVRWWRLPSSPPGEDIDLLMRLVLSGHTVVYQPSAIARHSHKRDLTALRRTIYNYGVGLGAVMTKCLITEQARRRDPIGRLPQGLVYALHPNSAKNAAKTLGYPRTLTVMEICGMARGPAYYASAARTARRYGAQP